MRPNPEIQNPADDVRQKRNVQPSAPLAHLSVQTIPPLRSAGTEGNCSEVGKASA